MAEVKTNCPNCFSKEQCFEESTEHFTSYICFQCGFTSNSYYKNDTKELEQAVESSTQLMNEISVFDYDRKITWFPSVLNMGKFGIIYPDGTKNNWMWKYAEVTKLTEEEMKDAQYEGHEHKLDVDNSKSYGQHEFMDACKDMGIIKE